MTIRSLRKEIIQKLSASLNPAVRNSPGLDADILLGFFLGWNRSRLLAHDEDEFPESLIETVNDAVVRRLAGTPVAYITGQKEFFGRVFSVSPSVLIPKPDTELLVEKALEFAEDFLRKNTGTLRIIDMCSGSGCVGISIAAELLQLFPQRHISLYFADISEKALSVTVENAEKILGKSPNLDVHYVISDLFSSPELQNPECGPFNLIVTNPPYVPASITDELLKDGRGEPRLALDGDNYQPGKNAASGGAVAYDAGLSSVDAKSRGLEDSCDGLSLIRALIPQCREHLADCGALFMETGEYNAEKTASYFCSEGFFDIVIHRDLQNQLRMVEGHR